MELLTLIKKWLREIETGVNWTQRIERHLICELGTQTQRPWTREVTCDELYLKRRNCDSRRFKSNIQHRSNELSIFYDHSTIPLTLLYALHNQGTDTHLIIRNHHFFHCTFQLCTHGCISIPLLGKEEQLITIYSCWIGIHVSMRHRNSRLIAPSRTRWQGITTSRVKLIQKCRVSEKIKFHETWKKTSIERWCWESCNSHRICICNLGIEWIRELVAHLICNWYGLGLRLQSTTSPQLCLHWPYWCYQFPGSVTRKIRGTREVDIQSAEMQKSIRASHLKMS